ncbi:OmpA family protein [uncultured Shewanella sp.]|uniref:OmpA family protein n=1 Tax=Shewanella atlantica TaxID=271099 RepID=UPI002633C929|nr:OmpA family protein [uncultured Shewanella sp.]
MSNIRISSVFPLCVLALSSLSFVAVADEPRSSQAQDSAFSSYFYLGGKLGQMHYQNACEPWSLSCDGNDLSFGASAGYQLWEHIGFEAAYLDLGEAVAVYPESGVNQTYIGSMSGIELSVSARLPVSENFDLFAKAGTFHWDGENQGPVNRKTDSDWAPIAGLGLEYKLSASWVARLEYQYIDSLGSDYIGGSNGHLTTLGLSYRFGQGKSQPEPKTQPVTLRVVVEQEVIPAPVVLAAISVTALFDFDSSAINDPLQFQPVIERLNSEPHVKVLITGYTDSKGSTDYNLALSQRRAQSIADHLMANGVMPEQIEVRALGESSPVIDNSTESNRHRNRRVMVHVPSTTTDER